MSIAPTVAIEAQTPRPSGGSTAAGTAVDPANNPATPESRKQAREIELEAIQESIAVSENRQAGLKVEIEAMESDRAAQSKTLLETAQRVRRTESEIGRIESRLESLYANEDGVRDSLRGRRAVLAEVLAALQRMGRTPPPAIISQPQDALAAIRSSILAGAVLPDIRVEAEALAANLQELTDLRRRIENELNTLKTRYAALGEEQARINLLIETKKRQREKSLDALEAERRKAAVLAEKAESVEALIAALAKETGSVAAAADALQPANPAEAARLLADTGRLGPAVRFIDAKGLLPLPVTGETKLAFGADDGLGGKAKGMTVAARSGMRVISPADGWVVYAGPFRSYGNILILNAGSGYHIVLAGMERIDVVSNQFVLAGEPVAVMGARQFASLGDLDHTSVQPLLYVEFRKDGNSIDPSPWWDRRYENEVRG
ncbi:MAG TPA: peptidoglycan DD-metalloendopeptidase family protein [Afifellaceae bacterium]|nr:peptidoglycan DD-metalloendopeptidase family protein [Afifellaceae bacterium]